ncbi:beta-mannosidase [Geobacillus kaustophilus NBRC 102445]|uniref:cellulase family glycosylhydrolase n=1 Tax=Geobacillus thermoleovorans group TaxID=1505648 RepID=UPI0010BF4267|nr:cellulase family glycosylhydrolase [Geobacillus kaustophilus]MED4971841.1 cellulase family glycosylhydrolase [Geobacillus thermoleovorans]QCK83069.1 beta-mannosidase [Geobacillus kaustophilus NBRC 102445]
MNKKWSYTFIALLVSIVCAVVPIFFSQNNVHAKTKREPATPTKDNEFVYRKGDKLMIGNKEFRFVGTNNYYLHYKSNQMIDDVIESAKKMGIKVIRLWGFFDGMTSENQAHNTYMQYEMGKYMGEGPIPKELEGAQNGFERLDYTIYKAKQEGIRLVIVLTNNWNNFGGMMQYVNWIGETNHDLFYTDERIKTAYKNYVHYLINRKNQYTGIIYKNEPTIMAWELANEPRNDSDPTGDTLVRWADEMSTYIKSIDPHHLVAVGDEGFFRRSSGGFNGEGSYMYTGYNGVDWDRLIALKNIDYGTFHLYPEHWGISPENVEKWGEQYILDHLAAGKKAKKPVVLEEYGISATGVQNREMIYDTWNRTMFEHGGTGAMFWLLTGIDDNPESADENGYYPDYDGFRIVNDHSSVTNLLKTYAKLFNGDRHVEKEPKVYFAFPAKPQDVRGTYRVKVKVASDQHKVQKVQLQLSSHDEAYTMKYNASFDYYEFDWDTTKEIEDSTVTLKATATLTNKQTIASDEVTVNIQNASAYEIIKQFSFDSDMNNVYADGTWQANFGIPALARENEMLRVNVDLPGNADWEEVKVKISPISELSETSRISFDLLLPRVDVNGALRPYIALNPGWIKIGVDQYHVNVNDLTTVTIHNQQYKLLHVNVEFNAMPNVNELFLNIVGNKLAYKGPIYIDNVTLFKKI